MRKDPIRLEEWLTRDYVDRAAKLRGLQAAHPDLSITTEDLVATWVVVALIITWVVMSW